MSSGFTAPPQHDFQACSRLMSDQAGHLATLRGWSDDQCASPDGLEGLLSPLKGLIPQLARPFTEKLAQCQRGMDDVSGKITLTGQDYARADQASVEAVRGLYPSAIPYFPDIGALHLPQVGNFTDQAVSLQPAQSAEEDTSKNMEHEILVIRTLLGNGPLGLASKAFLFLTGQDLITLLIHPLLGEYGRLLYLHDAYTELPPGLTRSPPRYARAPGRSPISGPGTPPPDLTPTCSAGAWVSAGSATPQHWPGTWTPVKRPGSRRSPAASTTG